MNVKSQRYAGLVWLRWIASWSAFPVGLVAAAYALHGRSVAEKTATELVAPIALVWWISLVLAIKLWRKNERRTASIVFCMMLLVYLASAPITARLPMHFLESMNQSTKLSTDDPLDTLIVLGGGTSEAPDGRAQFASSGDRVGLALQLHHQGLVKHLVVTGDGLRGLENATYNDPSMQAKRILIGMGVPETAIEELAGSNTSQEILSLKMRPDLWKGKRCGLLTSAFHMPRALRLAKKNGIEVLPILADYRVHKNRLDFRDLLPGSYGAGQTDLALREFIGMLIGR